MSNPLLPLLIEPEDLVPYLRHKQLCVVDLSSASSYLTGHIPGALHLPPQALIAGQPPAPGKLPDIRHLRQLFAHLGHTPETHYVICDDEGGGWAGRFAWTLDVIGHSRYTVINGGMLAWHREGLPVAKTIVERQPTEPNITIHRGPIAEIPDILENIGKDNFVVWDARSPEEYRGEKILAAKGGHIPGAVNCEWTTLMNPDRNFRIREDAREYLASLGINDRKEIITHCQSHHRSGFTYLAGKIFGFNIRGYHGSWSEWGNHPDTPVEVCSTAG